MTILVLFSDGLLDHLRGVPRKDIFKLSASSAASEYCEWVQVGSDVYIPHYKYQVKPRLSQWFSAAFEVRHHVQKRSTHTYSLNDVFRTFLLMEMFLVNENELL